MPSIPCLKSESRCFPCAGDSSNPFANLSIEPFDTNIWLSVSFGRTVNVVPNSWRTDACVGFCESSISQMDADDCARRRVLECLPEPPDPPRPPPPDPPPLPFLNHTFCNDAVSCQSGSNCYTLPECTVLGNSKAEANALAQSLCESRVLDLSLASPCGGGAPPLPPPIPPGPTVTYEKAWNTTPGEVDLPRGEWTTSDPCPWPDDYASTWIGGPVGFVDICLCNGDNADPYQWPFGEGSPTDPDSIIIQMDNVLDAALDSYVLPDTALIENVSTLERLYLRTRIEGGVTGKHVIMQGHWTKPGGAWTERYFNGDTLMFDDSPAESRLLLSFKYDPCSIFQSSGFPGSEPQVDEVSAVASSGDVTYEFDVPAGGIYYACINIWSKTHANGPSMVHMVTTITDL